MNNNALPQQANENGDILKRCRRNFFMTSNTVFDIEMGVYPKIVYTYLSRCADNVGQSFPGRAKIADKCEISVRTVDRAINVLIAEGLLSKEAQFLPAGKGKKRRQTVNLYTIYDEPFQDHQYKEPAQTPSSNKERHTVTPPVTHSRENLRHTVTPPVTEVRTNQYPRKDTQKTTIPMHEDQSVSQSKQECTILASPPKPTEEQTDRPTDSTPSPVPTPKPPTVKPKPPAPQESPTVSPEAIAQYTATIKQNIEYDNFVANRPEEERLLLNNIVAIMIDVMVSQSPQSWNIRIGQQVKPRTVVIGAMLKLTGHDIDVVMHRFMNVREGITNKAAYLLTMLYNQYLESEAEVINTVNVGRINAFNIGQSTTRPEKPPISEWAKETAAKLGVSPEYLAS